MKLPTEILLQHIAVLGKTGSGKTSTAKLAIEQVVADGARVCVLDPIKSDWWGLTSSKSGARAGLPFHILGGPHGHVPLHSAAGKAIADVVASGALPLSIIDMADFEPGGQAKFFVDFAPTLLRKMRGVVYLVIEEAHLFAPKERSGIGQENLSIHWSKTLATAGRSKGVRLVLVTQRTQALHNALLGSCDTLIAHRLTAPADQEPVVKWLKANTSKEVLEEVSSSLASLKTGEGWICSGEAKVFKRVQFPGISTYDNTATPTGDGDTREIKTAAVDPDKLRAIIGDAVEKAKADDPRELRKQLAEANRMLASQAKAIGELQARKPAGKEKRVEVPVLKDTQIARIEKLVDRFGKSLDVAMKQHAAICEPLQQLVSAVHAVRRQAQPPAVDRPVVQPRASYAPERASPAPRPRRVSIDTTSSNGHASGITSRQQRFLDAAATLTTLNSEVTRESVCAWIGVHPRGGSVGEELKALEVAGLVTNDRGKLAVTAEGMAAAMQLDPAEAIERAKGGLSNRQVRFFNIITAAYPHGVTREAIAEEVGIHPRGGSLGEDLGRLVGRGLVERDRGAYRAREFLFASN